MSKCWNCGATAGLYILLGKEGHGCRACCEKVFPRKVLTWRETYTQEMGSLASALLRRCDDKEYKRVMRELEKVLDSAVEKGIITSSALGL